MFNPDILDPGINDRFKAFEREIFPQIGVSLFFFLFISIFVYSLPNIDFWIKIIGAAIGLYAVTRLLIYIGVIITLTVYEYKAERRLNNQDNAFSCFNARIFKQWKTFVIIGLVFAIIAFISSDVNQDLSTGMLIYSAICGLIIFSYFVLGVLTSLISSLMLMHTGH